MAKTKTETRGGRPDTAFQLRKDGKPTRESNSRVHLLGPGKVCDTEARGHSRPRGMSPAKIVVDASEGFIPLWTKGTILRWRFRERSMQHFANPAAAKNGIRKLLGESLLEWGKASPVKFKEDDDLWDFEVVMRKSDDCDASGCTLASAFFPDGGRHQLVFYPMMFTQTKKEQVETLVHELGHIFGLRHFFAQIEEEEWPSEIFGKHRKFSIMNYGELSRLTDADRSDLTRLYKQAWSGALTEINGTPIRLVKPYSTLAANRPGGVFAMDAVPQPRAASVAVEVYD